MADRLNEFCNSLEREILTKEAENQSAKRGIVELSQEITSHV
jgi:hypothetical protein